MLSERLRDKGGNSWKISINYMYFVLIDVTRLWKAVYIEIKFSCSRHVAYCYVRQATC